MLSQWKLSSNNENDLSSIHKFSLTYVNILISLSLQVTSKKDLLSSGEESPKPSFQDKDFIIDCLCWHNEYRARHGAPALSVSAEVGWLRNSECHSYIYFDLYIALYKTWHFRQNYRKTRTPADKRKLIEKFQSFHSFFPLFNFLLSFFLLLPR
jgi:hypothetical protein